MYGSRIAFQEYSSSVFLRELVFDWHHWYIMVHNTIDTWIKDCRDVQFLPESRTWLWRFFFCPCVFYFVCARCFTYESGVSFCVHVPRREAGDVWCLPPVWNLRAVIWFHFAISCLVLLPSPVTLSILSFSACWSFLLNFFLKILQYFSLRDRLFCMGPV